LVTKGKFGINRKMLSLLARENIESFDKVISEITGNKIERKIAPEIKEEIEIKEEKITEVKEVKEVKEEENSEEK
jgi:hypothetical protein